MNKRLKLLINNAIYHLAATAPVQKRARDSGFEVAEDGRLIIPEEEGDLKKSEKASGMCKKFLFTPYFGRIRIRDAHLGKNTGSGHRFRIIVLT